MVPDKKSIYDYCFKYFTVEISISFINIFCQFAGSLRLKFEKEENKAMFITY